jgi:CheY-like chemotaxis protein
MMQLIGMDAEAIEVLLVEDSPGDVRLTREAFKDAKVHISLNVASDGAEAMDFLNREGEHANAPRPDLILLDLNLPKKDGREVLEEIKESPTLKSIPVVVLTTSASEGDILRSYKLHANCYITKPVGLDGFLEVVKSIDSFWLTVVKLPSEPRTALMKEKALQASSG